MSPPWTLPSRLASVAEAIDFCEFYAREMIRLAEPRRRDVPGETNACEHIARGGGPPVRRQHPDPHRDLISPVFQRQDRHPPAGRHLRPPPQVGVGLRREIVQEEAEPRDVRPERVEQRGVGVEQILEGHRRRPAGRAVVDDERDNRREPLRARVLCAISLPEGDKVTEQAKRHPGVNLALVLGEHIKQHPPPPDTHRVDKIHPLLVEVFAPDRHAALQAQGGPGDLLYETGRQQRSEQAAGVAQLGEGGLEERVVRGRRHGGQDAWWRGGWLGGSARSNGHPNSEDA